MSCGCSSAASGGNTIITGAGGVTVTGAGTPTSPYVVSVSPASSLSLTVRDSATVDMLLTGSGVPSDPYVLRADTGSVSSLRGLADVALSPTATQGKVPMWTGAESTGHFEFRTPGVRYTTSTTRGNGFYQGEIARDTDTQKRWEWDGSQWLSLDQAASALDPSIVANAGTITSSTDWNTLTARSGIYRVASISGTNNSPAGAATTGTLVVFISGTSVTQVYYPFEVSSSGPWIRTKFGDTDWVAWARGAVDLSNYYTKAASDALYYSKTAGDARYAAQSEGTSGITYGSGVTVNQGVDVVRVGPTVTFRWNISLLQSKAVNDNLVQLPSGYRPRGFSADTTGHNGVNMWGVAVDTDGWLRLRTASHPGGGFWGSISFPAA